MPIKTGACVRVRDGVCVLGDGVRGWGGGGDAIVENVFVFLTNFSNMYFTAYQIINNITHLSNSSSPGRLFLH